MSTVIAFFIKHLPAFILAFLIAVICYQFYSITSERDKAIRDYTELKHAFDIAKAENAGKLAALSDEGKRNLADQKAKHLSDIQIIGISYGKEIKNDKDAITYRDAVISKLRQQQAANSGDGVPKDDGRQLASSDSDTNTVGRGEEYWKQAYSGAQEYIKVLKEAGAMCAADYNACFIYKSDEQARLGVENSLLSSH